MPATRLLLAMIEQGMANTDARVAEDKPVTPAFLFAVLLWGEVREQAQAVDRRRHCALVAWQRAAHRVVAAQAQHVAIPRRFTSHDGGDLGVAAAFRPSHAQARAAPA